MDLLSCQTLLPGGDPLLSTDVGGMDRHHLGAVELGEPREYAGYEGGEEIRRVLLRADNLEKAVGVVEHDHGHRAVAPDHGEEVVEAPGDRRGGYSKGDAGVSRGDLFRQ